ncbi:MAG: DEAD/DEAH box helicase family protein, partial [Fimbriimonadaceae bacterium]|nr:DEAD/DEAH box helicase family protein [Fimbriimonadaceae bacterium]
MSLRLLQLSRVYDDIQRALTLRRPQRNSLLKLHDWLSSTPSPVAELDPQERMFAYRESFPQIPQTDDYPSAVFALATGVGKTRLMGAIIAYLYGAGESSNFLVLAPRRAILRQIIEQLKPASNKYLFGSEALVSSPRIWHAGNLEQFGLPTSELDLGLRGPDIFVFSPQSFVGGERRAARPSSDFSDISILTSLKERKDLVVLVDEAHHLPGSAGKSE